MKFEKKSSGIISAENEHAKRKTGSSFLMGIKCVAEPDFASDDNVIHVSLLQALKDAGISVSVQIIT